MTLETLFALGALAAAGAPDYALERARFPFFTAPGRENVLTDFRLGVAETDQLRPGVGARVRLGDRAFVGALLGEQRNAVSFTTWRGDLRLAEERGRVELGGSYRLRRVRARVDAFRRRDDQGSGWVFEAVGAYRVNPDVEIAAGYLDDADRRTAGIDDRPVESMRLQVLYQRGARFDAVAEATKFKRRTVGGIDIEGDSIGVAAVGLALGAEWRGGFRYEWLEGRLGRELGEGSLDVVAPVPRFENLVVTAGTTQHWEPHIRRFEEGLRAGVTYYARRFRLARAGEAGRRALELARRATALGLNERRVYDEAGLRALRERLSLSPEREALRGEIDALYQAQIAERNVPLLGFAFERRRDEVEGRLSHTYRATLGVPWPLGWPFQRDEGAVRFVTFSFAHTDDRFDSGYRSVRRQAALDVELNRETSLVVRWSEPERAPVHAALRRSPPPSFEVALVYAYGR